MSIQKEALTKEFQEGKIALYFLSEEPMLPGLPSLVCRKLAEDKVAILAWSDRKTLDAWRLSHPLITERPVKLKIDEIRTHINQMNPQKKIKYTIELINEGTTNN